MGLDRSVNLHAVLPQLVAGHKLLTTFLADDHVVVDLLVGLQAGRSLKRLPAVLANVRSFPGVSSHVSQKRAMLRKTTVTVFARVTPFASVDSSVAVEFG
jgi:hypothetical protein